MQVLRGRVQSVIFAKDSYYVLAFEVEDSDPATKERLVKVRGHIHGLVQVKAGVSLCLQGDWVNHAKFGMQLVTKSWEPWASSLMDIRHFLQTCVEGFLDAETGRALVAQFGEGTFEALSDSGKVLEALPDAPKESLEKALSGWQRMCVTRDLATVLRNDGLGANLIRDILSVFGVEAGKVVRKNPYRLMVLPGMSFEVADGIALNIGIPYEDPRRVGGAILWALRESGKEGHLFLRRSEIPSVVSKLAFAGGGAPTDSVYDQALANLSYDDAVRYVPGVGIYLADLLRYEQDTAQMLVHGMTPVHLDVDVDKFLEEYERGHKLELSELQKESVRLLLNNRVLVLTGLPGTGKTTVVRTIVKLFEVARLRLLLLAPTGIAAKRLSSVTGHVASTVHRALKYDGSCWGHHADNKVVVDAVVVDECSMVDQELIYRLLSALQPGTILVFVGDDAQLPSVGPGSVLRELVSCAALPRVRLTQIFRQSERSDIVLNSHRINRGEPLHLGDQQVDSEFRFVPIRDEDLIVDLIVKMAIKLKARDANFQVLSPQYRGPAGVLNLNDRLREALNPYDGQPDVKWGDFNARVGDRLMVIQNDYKKGVYNGDVGKLTAIDHGELIVRVHNAGIGGTDMVVRFTRNDATKIRLAYAVTVHRCQGLEFDTIILPVVCSQGRMLQRNLLYTAVTRARSKVWLLGDETAIHKAIANDKVLQRNTRLSNSILTLFNGGGVGARMENSDG